MNEKKHLLLKVPLEEGVEKRGLSTLFVNIPASVFLGGKRAMPLEKIDFFL